MTTQLTAKMKKLWDEVRKLPLDIQILPRSFVMLNSKTANVAVRKELIIEECIRAVKKAQEYLDELGSHIPEP